MKPLKLTKSYQRIVLYGIVLAVLVFFLKWVQWNFLIVDNAIDIYIGRNLEFTTQCVAN